jgi:hypothetical protein
LKGRCQEISFDFWSSPSDMQWKDPELPEFDVKRADHSGKMLLRNLISLS